MSTGEDLLKKYKYENSTTTSERLMDSYRESNGMNQPRISSRKQKENEQRQRTYDSAVSTAQKLGNVTMTNVGRRLTTSPEQQTSAQKALENDSLYSASNPFSHFSSTLRQAAQTAAANETSKTNQNNVDWAMELKTSGNDPEVLNKLTGKDGNSIKQQNIKRATDYIDYLNQNYEGASDYLSEYEDSLNGAEKALVTAGRSVVNLNNSMNAATKSNNLEPSGSMAGAARPNSENVSAASGEVVQKLINDYGMTNAEAKYWASNYGTLKGILDNKAAEEVRNEYIKRYDAETLQAMKEYVVAKRNNESEGDLLGKATTGISLQSAKNKLKSMGINPADKGEYQQLFEYMYANVGAEESEQITEGISNLVEKYPATTIPLNLLDVATSPYTGIMATVGTAINDARKMDKTQPSDTGATWYMPHNTSTAIQNATNEEIQRVADKNSVSADIGRFAYGVGSSTAKSMLGMAMGGVAGSIASELGVSAGAARAIAQLTTLPSFGGTAYASTLKEQLDKGIGQDQAQAYAVISGINEMLYEELSLDKAYGIYTSNAAGKVSLKKTIFNILSQSGIEGSEEVFTELSNRFADAVVNQDFSEHNTNVRMLKQQGYSQEQAESIVKQQELKQLLETFLAGAASGGITGVVTTTAGKINYNSTAKNIINDKSKTQAVYEQAKASAPANSTARQIIENTTAETITEEQVAQVLESLAESGSTSAEQVITDAFIRAGETEEQAKQDAQTVIEMSSTDLSDTLTDEQVEQRYFDNSELTDDERYNVKTANEIEERNAAAIENNPTLGDVYADYITGRLQNPAAITAAAQQVAKQERQQARAEKFGETFDRVTQPIRNVTNKINDNKISKNSVMKAQYNGQEIDILGVQSIKPNGKIMLNTSEGRIDIADIQLDKTSEAARVLHILESTENAKAVNYALQKFDRENAYLSGVIAKQAFHMGQNGVDISKLLESNDKSTVHAIATLRQNDPNDAFIKAMYEIGVNSQEKRDVMQADKDKYKVIKREKSDGFEVAQNDELYDFKRTVKDYGGFNFITDYSESRFNGSWMYELATMTSSNGRNEYAAITHEMFEFTKSMAPESYKLLSDAVMNLAVDQLGWSEVNDIIKKYQEAYRKSGLKGTKNKTYEQAKEEFINDFMSGSFSTEEGARQFIEHISNSEEFSASEKANIFESFAAWVDHLLDTIREYFTKPQQLGSEAALKLEKAGTDLTEIRKLAFKALDDAKAELNKQLGTEMGRIVQEDMNESAEDIPEGTEFSLNTPVEQTGKLIALHNLNESKLLSTFDLGGFAMPSIAVTKTDISHEGFGDISIIFDRSTVHPNEVYSGDAWTPMFPRVQYKLNNKAISDIKTKLIDIVGEEDYKRVIAGIDESNLDDKINNRYFNNSGVDYGRVFETDDGLKYAFLKSKDKSVTVPLRNETISSVMSIEDIDDIIKTLGRDNIDKMYMGGYQFFNENKELSDKLKELANEKYAAKYSDKPFAKKLSMYTDERWGFGEYDRIVRMIFKYMTTGVKQVVDTNALREMTSSINQEEYSEWLNELFANVIEKKGYRNGKDLYTPSGNRRSFEQLHSEATLENAVKLMKEEKEKGGAAMFVANSIFGAATRAYKSIDEMKKDINRLQKLSVDEIKEKRSEFISRFAEIADRMCKRGMPTSGAMEAINDAVAVSKTRNKLVTEMNKNKQWYNIDESIINDVWELVSDIAKMPTTYFEAKPRRAVGFDEIKRLIVPSSVSQKLLEELNKRNIPYSMYQSGDNDDRLAKLNQAVEETDAAFSIDVEYENAVKSGNTELALKLIRQEAEKAFPDSKARVYNRDIFDDKTAKDGELRTFYHGTNSDDFNVFDIGQLGSGSGDVGWFGKGFYFAFGEGEARYYGSRVIPAFLNTVNPFYIKETLESYEGYEAHGSEASDAIYLINVLKYLPELVEGVTVDAFNREEFEVTELSVEEFAKQFEDIFKNTKFTVDEIDGTYGKEYVVTAGEFEESFTDYEGKVHTFKDYKYKKRFLYKKEAENQLDNAWMYLSEVVYDSIEVPKSVVFNMEHDLTKSVKDRGYDSIYQGKEGDEVVLFDPAQIKRSDITYDDEGKLIPLSQRFNTESNDMRYSINVDSEGNNLSEQQIEFFNDSVIRNEEGRLKPMYHGTQTGGFTVFDVKKARSNGHYGSGFYFSDSPLSAYSSGDVYKVYLNITNPVSQIHPSKTITKAQLTKFVQELADNEDYGIENYGSSATVKSIVNELIKSESDFNILNDLNATCVGDFAQAVKLFNEVNGTNFDGIEVLTETVAFRPEQIKRTTNENPTSNVDINYSIDVDNFYEAVMEMEEDITRGMDRLAENVSQMMDFESDISKTMVGRVSKNIKKTFGSTIKTKELEDKIMKVFSYLRETGSVTAQDIELIRSMVGEPVVDSIKPDVTKIEEYNRFISGVKTWDIAFNDAQMQEIRNKYDSYYGFKRFMSGKLNLNKNGVNLDDIWTEICDLSGGALSYGENPNNQPIVLAEYINSLEPKANILDEQSYESATLSVAMELFREFFTETANKDAAIKMRDEVVEYNKAVKKRYENRYKEALKEVEKAKAVELERLQAEIETLTEEQQKAIAEGVDALESARIKQIRDDAVKRLEALRKQRDEAIAKVKADYQNKKLNDRTKKQWLEAKHKLQKEVTSLQNMLAHPKEGASKHVPIQLVNATIDLLEALQMDDGRNKATTERLAKLAQVYNNLRENTRAVESDKTNFGFDYDARIAADIEEIKNMFEGGRFYTDLYTPEIERILEIVRALKTQIQNANNLIINGRIEDARAIALDGMQEVTDSRKGKFNFTDTLDRYGNMHLNPYRLMRKISGYSDGAIMRLYEDLQQASLKEMQIQQELNDIFKNVLDGSENQKEIKRFISTKEKDLVDIGIIDENGNPVKVSRAMRMSIIMHSMNESNMHHIIFGGITVPNMKVYARDKARAYSEYGKIYRFLDYSKYLEAVKNKDYETQNKLLTEARKIVNSLESDLSEWEVKFLEAAKEMFHTRSGEYINDTSVKLKGYTIAKVQNYFPIKTDTDFTPTDFAKLVMNGTIEGKGMLKERVQSKKPIVLEDITDVIQRQIRDTSKYAAFAIPVRNFKLAMRQTFRDSRGEATTLEKHIREVWNVSTVDNLRNMITTIETGRGIRDEYFKVLSKIRSNFAGAVLSINPSVAIKQAASYPTAAAVVGYEPLIKAVKDMPKGFAMEKGIAELEKINPLLWYRAQGYGSQDLADAKASGFGKNLPTKLQKAISWTQFMDTGTVRTLEYASKYYVDSHFKSLEKGSSEYWEKVSEVFTQVVTETQPNYDTMHKANIIRDGDALVKMLFMFKTQPMQNFGILYDAIGELNANVTRYNNDKSDINKAKAKDSAGKLARAVTSQLLSAVTFSAMSILARLLLHKIGRYRDDDDEWSWKKLLAEFGEGIMSCLTGMFLGGSEIYQTATYWAGKNKYYNGIEVSSIEAVNDFGKNIGYLKTAVEYLWDAQTTAERDMYIQKVAKYSVNLGTYAGQIMGVPTGNIYNIIQAIILYGIDAVNSIEEKQVDISLKSNLTEWEVKSQYERMYQAFKNNDMDEYNKLVDEVIATGKTEKDIESKLKSMFKSEYLDENMSADEAIDALAMIGMDEAEAGHTINQWNTGNTSDYGAVKQFISEAAADPSDANRRQVVSEVNNLVAIGKTKENIVKTLKTEFKDEYIEGKNRVNLNAILRQAIVAAGYTDTEAKDILSGWLG